MDLDSLENATSSVTKAALIILNGLRTFCLFQSLKVDQIDLAKIVLRIE